MEEKVEKKSYFDLGRVLSATEYGELKSWKKDNPLLAWKAGEKRNDGKLFLNYSPTWKNGEAWVVQADYEKKLIRARKWRQENKDGQTQRNRDSIKKLIEKDPEYKKKKDKKFRNNIPADKKEKLKEIVSKKAKEKRKNRTEEQRERDRTKNREYKRKRLEDPFYRFKVNVRNLITGSFKRKLIKKNERTESVLGCSLEEFRNHIQNQFEPWMNWENYGGSRVDLKETQSWQIDHIAPIGMVETEEEILALNHYTNLRPLCSYTNMHIKRAKLDWGA